MEIEVICKHNGRELSFKDNFDDVHNMDEFRNKLDKINNNIIRKLHLLKIFENVDFIEKITKALYPESHSKFLCQESKDNMYQTLLDMGFSKDIASKLISD